ncbi:MAG: glycosyltransferase family 4 protein [Ignavibacteriae bacterium]|nr:glycosyltransferase family 4 protein [Ignavibacteriota bacterium]
MKILTIVSAGLGRPDRAELTLMERSDEYPRVSLYERILESDMLDEKFMQNVPRVRRALYRFLPMVLAQVIEAYLIRKRYDAVITWAERLGLPFALILKITGSKTPHLMLSSWISKRKKAMMVKFVQSHITKIFMWSTVQRDYAINVLGIPSSKIAFVRKFADQQFWRPMQRETDIICSVGAEMRDYPTLIEAMRGLDIRCHIAAAKPRGKTYSTITAIEKIGQLPPNVTAEPKSYKDLRELYARSRFVVVPLLQSETDNGLTCILEAMAMGKAVICSKTKGQIDVIKEGETGIYVPQGDHFALREVIQRLWNNPEEAERMGKQARKVLEERHTFEQFVYSVRAIVEEVIRKKTPSRAFNVTEVYEKVT